MLLCLVRRRDGQSKQECNLQPVPHRESIIHRTLMASWRLWVFPSVQCFLFSLTTLFVQIKEDYSQFGVKVLLLLLLLFDNY